MPLFPHYAWKSSVSITQHTEGIGRVALSKKLPVSFFDWGLEGRAVGWDL